jgi:hypothetical protein
MYTRRRSIENMAEELVRLLEYSHLLVFIQVSIAREVNRSLHVTNNMSRRVDEMLNES